MAALACLIMSGLALGCTMRREAPSARLVEPRKEARKTTAARYLRKPVSRLPSPSFEGEKGVCETSEACVSKLKAMLDDKSRSWIGKPQSVAEHFSGTRQFAYIALSKELACPNLASALSDLDRGAKIVDGKHGFTVRREAAIRLVNARAQTDLRREMATRCRN